MQGLGSEGSGACGWGWGTCVCMRVCKYVLAPVQTVTGTRDRRSWRK